MQTLMFILLIAGIVAGIVSYMSWVFEDKLSSNIFRYISLLFIGTSIAIMMSDKKEEEPTTIYTSRDIYYIYKDSLTSESGSVHVIGDWKKAYIELLTARDTDSLTLK